DDVADGVDHDPDRGDEADDARRPITGEEPGQHEGGGEAELGDDHPGRYPEGTRAGRRSRSFGRAFVRVVVAVIRSTDAHQARMARSVPNSNITSGQPRGTLGA